ncbi:MFS transporter [Sulfobacillus sp. hq2]|uniref:MFS transporter n=1 Tax=Sulfobacillus TaxID=28033 RepID=UPI000CD1197D|nr:MFS transporter [Sulfobacillus sp. hq2]POB09836.1 MFS transporter [Sulfobacillus sp. hq2]
MSGSKSMFAPLDQAKFSWFHGKSIFTTGMGVFTDGYDLSSIGIVLTLALASFGVKSLTGLESSMLAGSALVGAAIGAIVFGFLANKGRKAFYGLDVLIMAIAALAQAFVTNIPELIIVRLILGIGVGADYVLSPLIMGEHANAADRGKSIALGFGITWGLGATFAAVLYLALQALHVPPNLIWRIVLAAGSVPAASVIYLRRKMPETARFLARIAGDSDGVEKVVAQVAGTHEAWQPQGPVRDTHTLSYYFAHQWKRFVAAATLWFLFDIVAYSGILFGPSLIAKGIGLSPGTFQLVMEFAFVVPGGILALLLIDRWGRKPLQVLGFIGMALSLMAFSLYRTEAAAIPLIGLMLYGLENFIQQAGPGSVSASGILGVELAPTKVRSLVQGLTVASGRLGASLTAFVFPAIFKALGESFAIGFLASIAALAAIITMVAIPETKKQSLEVNAQEHMTDSLDLEPIA